MGALILPHRLQQQPQQAPQLDQSNPLTRGLVLAVLPGLHRGANLAARRPSTTVGTKQQAMATGVAAGFGPAVGAGTTDRITTTMAGAFPTSGGRSYYFRAKRNGIGGGGLGRLFDKTTSSSGQFLCWYDNGGGMMYGFYAGASAETNLVIPGTGGGSGTAAIGAVFDLYITHSYIGTTNTINAWANGAQVLVNSVVTGALVDAASAALTIGNRSSDLARNWDGLIECAYAWDRALLPSEVAALAQNRYQLFKAPARRLWRASAAAAPGPVTGTFASAEAGDLLAATGTASFTPVSGTSSSTEPSDTLSATGGAGFAAVTGTGSTAEGGDTLASSGAATFYPVSGAADTAETADTVSATGAALSPITGSMAASEAPDTLVAGTMRPPEEGSGGSGGGGAYGGSGSVREVRAFAAQLDRADKPTKNERKRRKRAIEAAVLELLPDEPTAERAAPVIAQIVARELPAAVWAPARAMQPVAQPKALPAAVVEDVRERVAAWLAEQQLLAQLEDDFETELLLMG